MVVWWSLLNQGSVVLVAQRGCGLLANAIKSRYKVSVSNWSSHSNLYFTFLASTNYPSNWRISHTAFSFTLELYCFGHTEGVVSASLDASYENLFTKSAYWRRWQMFDWVKWVYVQLIVINGFFSTRQTSSWNNAGNTSSVLESYSPACLVELH